MKNEKEECYCSMIDHIPHLSLVLPFETKMNKQTELIKLLSSAADKIELEIKSKYSNEITDLLMARLRRIIAKIYCTNNKSIGIFLSTETEHIYYFTPTPDTYKKFPQVTQVKNE